MLKLMAGPVAATCSAACKPVVGQASGPHHFGPCIVVARLFHKYSGIVDHSLHQGLADAVSDLHSFQIDKVSFHGMHENIHTSALSLVLGQCISKSGI